MSKRYYAVYHGMQRWPGVHLDRDNGSTNYREARKIATQLHREYPGEDIVISYEREDDDYCDDSEIVYECSPVKYNIDFRGKRFVRSGMTAQEAIENLCDQYGWRFNLHMYDAYGRGFVWANGTVDTNGGINYNEPIYAESKEEQ